MKTRIITIVILEFLLFRNSQMNAGNRDNLSLPNLINEAMMKFYPNTFGRETGMLLKPDGNQYEYKMEILEAGKNLELEAGQEGNIIKTESF